MGIKLVDDPEANQYPMPLTATGKNDVEVRHVCLPPRAFVPPSSCQYGHIFVRHCWICQITSVKPCRLLYTTRTVCRDLWISFYRLVVCERTMFSVTTVWTSSCAVISCFGGRRLTLFSSPRHLSPAASRNPYQRSQHATSSYAHQTKRGGCKAKAI